MLGLSCPYLPKIEAVAEKDGEVLVLEEFIQGDTLAFLLEGGPLPPAYARNIALDVCRALQELHALGIVHRDVKPENILLQGDKAVLIDFDASRLHKSNTSSDTRIMGTTGYAAPEQYGFSQTDARADIYSLGIFINEMLTQKHPSTCLAEGPLLPVIEKCIEVNIHRRYQSVAQVIAALEAVSLAGQKKPRHWLWLLPAVLLGTVLLLLSSSGPGAKPVPVSQSEESSGEPSTPSPVPESFFADTDTLSWTGPTESSHMEFEYDLDGDGETETYIFTLGHNLYGPQGLSLFGIDSRMLLPNLPSELVIAPAVMKYTETGLQYVWKFSELLQNQTITLYCAQQWGTGTPSIGDYGLLNGLWPGAVLIQYEAEDAGIWVYEATAELDGTLLTARGVSNIFASSSSDEQS